MTDKKKKKKSIFLLSFIVSLCIVSSSHAAPLIRDAEIENTLRMYADPIFSAAGLKPSAVKIFIVRDDSLNAYVAGGSNLFIHTGLILKATTPDMLLGVIAHETGHIAGGHLAKGSEKLKNAQMGEIFTYVLGAAAAVASKRPEAAAVVIGGGSTSIARNFLAFTRAHEEAADQAALGFLDQTNISASGMLKVFSLLERQRREHVGSVDPYLQTHPLSSTRIEHVRNHVNNSSIPDGQYPKKLDIWHKRMVAKLYSFLYSPEKTFLRYPQSDKSLPAKMARAVAYYKMPELDKSIAEMNALLKTSPNDVFLHELKGQIYFENGRVAEAMDAYQTAVEFLPNNALLLTDLGKVELAQKEPLITSAITHLEKSVSIDNTNPDAWHLLAVAYGKTQNTGMSNLALAEEIALAGDFERALEKVNVALPNLKEGTPAKRRALDLKSHAIEMVQRKKKEESPF